MPRPIQIILHPDLTCPRPMPGYDMKIGFMCPRPIRNRRSSGIRVRLLMLNKENILGITHEHISNFKKIGCSRTTAEEATTWSLLARRKTIWDEFTHDIKSSLYFQAKRFPVLTFFVGLLTLMKKRYPTTLSFVNTKKKLQGLMGPGPICPRLRRKDPSDGSNCLG